MINTMVKNSIFIISICLISCSSETGNVTKDPSRNTSDVHKEPSDLKKDGLKGKVKKVTINLFEPVMNGEQAQKGKLISTETIWYDQQGNMLSEVMYRGDGKFLDSSFYKRDASGKLIEEYLYESEEPDTRITYKHNEGGQITKASEYVSGVMGSKSTFSYNSNGFLKKKLSKDSEGDFLSLENYAYDKKGNLVGYKYEGVMNEIESYSYNENGERISRRHTNNMEKGPDSFNYIYEKRDQYSNWTIGVEYKDPDHPIWYTERVIQYYP